MKDKDKTKAQLISELEELRRRLAELEKSESLPSKLPFSADEQIQVSGIDIRWKTDRGLCTFENLPVAMMWVDTTLAGLMSGLQSMVGTKRCGLALQSEGRNSVKADWQVISQFSDFLEGFNAIANIAAVAGWGDWKLLSLDEEEKKCHFRVWNSWEGRYQKALGVCWGSGMLAGKLAGYCSKLFETNCWAEQTVFIAKGDDFDEFVVRPSERSIEREIENLLQTDEATRADMAVALQKLRKEVEERKRAEDELHKSFSLLTSTLESTADGILVVDRQGKIERFNQKFVDIWHIPDSIIASKDDSRALEFVLDQLKDPEAFITKVNELYSQPEAESYDTLEFKDGKILERYSQPQRKGEDIIGRVWSFRDVTERKQAEEGLRQSEEKYRLLVENVPSVVYRGYKDWSVDFFDDKVEVLTGYSMQEFNSRRIKWSDIVVEEDIAGARETFIEALKTDKSYVREYRIITKSGGILWIQERARIICDDKGEIDYVSGVFFDITERKIAEEALRANEERLQRLLEASPDPIVVYDMEGRATYINPAFEETFGWSSRELLGKNIEFVPDENWPETRAAIARMLRGERIQSFETRRLTKDGRTLDIQLSSSVFHDQDKNPVGNIVILRDVSKRKRAEQALRESEHYFRSLLFNMHEDILVIDRDYRVTDANNTLLVSTGLEYDKVIGRRCYAISHGYNAPCDRKGEDCRLREVFETGKPESCRHQHLRKDGSRSWVDILMSPLKDEKGNVTHVIEAIRDVSDLVEMEEVLRESEESFRALAENANDGILIAAGEAGVNLYANKRAAEITGYSVTELQDIGLHELVAPDEVKNVADRYKRRLAGNNVPSQYETHLVRKSREIFPVELSSARSIWKGEPVSIIIIRDITSRKRAEQTVLKSEAELVEKSRHLEEVNAALKVLLKQRENDKADLEERLLANVKELVLPYLEKLKNSRLHSDQMTLVGILEANMNEIVSPFVTKLSSRFLNLTPTEIQVASLIKDGKTSKEIAALLNASENTVRTHRFHIRSKLGIKNKKVNFRSYLQSLQY